MWWSALVVNAGAHPGAGVGEAAPNGRRSHARDRIYGLRGVVEMLACAKGQAADEDPSAGGYYTSLLMQSAELWDQRTIQPSTHSTKDAHDYAAAKLPSQQTPEYSPSWIDFPFAVST